MPPRKRSRSSRPRPAQAADSSSSQPVEPAPGGSRQRVPSQRKAKFRSYSPASGMEYVELSHKADYAEFEKRIAEQPDVDRVEHSDDKPPGDHYQKYYLNVYTKDDPKRYLQFELSTHNHYKDATNCSALYRRPPRGLEETAKRILRAAVQGWELNAPAPGGASTSSRSQRIETDDVIVDSLDTQQQASSAGCAEEEQPSSSAGQPLVAPMILSAEAVESFEAGQLRRCGLAPLPSKSEQEPIASVLSWSFTIFSHHGCCCRPFPSSSRHRCPCSFSSRHHKKRPSVA
jgi:hypothetical protein